MLQRKRKRKRSRTGLAPGEVEEADVEDHSAPRISAWVYDAEELLEREDISIQEAMDLVADDKVTWINIDGLGDLEVLETVWERFDIHPLVREDIVNTFQRPKFEEYPSQGFLVLPMIRLVDEELLSEQVSMVFGDRCLISFQETHGDVFGGVRDRLRKCRPRIRGSGPDYLAYSLLDAVVDEFFPILEIYGEWVEEIEDEALDDPQDDTIEEIHDLKRDFLQLRRALWPVRDAITSMQRTEGGSLLQEETRTFLRDAYDHVVRIMDMLETYRELATSVADAYYSTLSHRMNEVMKTLTIVATIFIPLTFIAGVYGMNFDPAASPWNMPELAWAYGYPAAWGVMILVAIGMTIMFQRRGWF